MSLGGFWYGVRSFGRFIRGLWRLIFCMAVLLVCGCMNLWTRNPLTDTRIERCYQSSSMMAGGALIMAFPQMMSDAPSSRGFSPWNLITIPCGCVVLCDAACEAVLDTVFLPADWPLSSYRRRKWKEWQDRQRENWDDEDWEYDQDGGRDSPEEEFSYVAPDGVNIITVHPGGVTSTTTVFVPSPAPERRHRPGD